MSLTQCVPKDCPKKSGEPCQMRLPDGRCGAMSNLCQAGENRVQGKAARLREALESLTSAVDSYAPFLLLALQHEVP